nr:MAG TPA_asm: hypothetical protein [Caudoviricetes sp.]
MLKLRLRHTVKLVNIYLIALKNPCYLKSGIVFKFCDSRRSVIRYKRNVNTHAYLFSCGEVRKHIVLDIFRHSAFYLLYVCHTLYLRISFRGGGCRPFLLSGGCTGGHGYGRVAPAGTNGAVRDNKLSHTHKSVDLILNTADSRGVYSVVNKLLLLKSVKAFPNGICLVVDRVINLNELFVNIRLCLEDGVLLNELQLITAHKVFTVCRCCHSAAANKSAECHYAGNRATDNTCGKSCICNAFACVLHKSTSFNYLIIAVKKRPLVCGLIIPHFKGALFRSFSGNYNVFIRFASRFAA